MSGLVDFLTLRPMFGMRALRVVWGLFLLDQALRLLSVIAGTQAAYAPMTLGRWLEFVPVLLTPAINILFARVLLDVAAVLLLGRRD
jgi:hypothetical protein